MMSSLRKTVYTRLLLFVLACILSGFIILYNIPVDNLLENTTHVFEDKPFNRSHPSISTVKCSDCNILLISIDALRADHLGAYGYMRNTSSNIDVFTEESILFEYAITPRPKTNPSIASLFTSQYPFRHGVRRNNIPLHSDHALPLLLGENGFNTAAIVSNWVLRPNASGLEKYFHIYDYDFTQSVSDKEEIYERNAWQTNQRVFEWFENNSKERFFLWIHYMDPHGPYRPPIEYQSTFISSEKDMVSLKVIPRYQILREAYLFNGTVDANYYRDQYDNEIHYTDKQVGELMSKLDEMNLSENTIVILTADHGESLGQHEYFFEHGDELYDDCARIPLMIRFPKRINLASKRIVEMVSIMDLYPMILDILNISIPADLTIDGMNILPLLHGKLMDRPPLYLEVNSGGHIKRASLRTNDYKIIMKGGCFFEGLNITCNASGFECYELSSDPSEENPKWCERPPYSYLKKSLIKSIKRANEEKVFREGVKPSVKDIRILRNLGYIY